MLRLSCLLGCKSGLKSTEFPEVNNRAAGFKVGRCHSVFVRPRKCSGGTNSLADSFRPEQLRGKRIPRICSVNSVDSTHLEHCEIEFIVKQFLS